MVNLPLISIAVCTFNGKNHLKQQLDSVVNQTYINKEIIIIDDKSTDGTFDLIKEYESKYTAVKIYQNEINLGYIKNFEKAISLCNGDFIALCDQDDIWVENKLTTLVKEIKTDEILIYHDSLLIDSSGNNLKKTLSNTIGYIDGSQNKNLLLNNCIAGHSVMFRASLKNKIFPFPVTIPHDHWLAYIALTVGKIQYLKVPLVYYRQHNFSLTYTVHLKDNQRLQIDQANRVTEKLKLNQQRILHLKTLKSFDKNNAYDIKFISRLIDLLSNRHKKSFALTLFFFLVWHNHELFKLYHKSFFSTIALIFKECKS